MDDNRKKQAQFSGAHLLLAFAALLFVQGVIAKRTAPKAVPMSELVQHVRDGKASEVLVRDADIVVELKAEGDQKPQRIVATRLPGIDETALVKEMQDKGVKFSGFIERTSWLQHRRATEILTRERGVLERMTRRLIEVETLDRAEIETLVAAPAVAAAKA